MFLTDFDGGKAVIEPSAIVSKLETMPKSCIGVFSATVFKEWVEKYSTGVITTISSVMGEEPIHKISAEGHEFAFFMPYIGAPSAGAQMEELIALGCEQFVIFGSSGVLRHDIADGHMIVPMSAIRDEGYSHHYIEPSDEIELDEEMVKVAEDTLKDMGIPFVGGKTWTTDCFYRETPRKVEKAKSMGAICVEMECAALAAVAKFRNVDFIQFLWSADNLGGEEWDKRSSNMTVFTNSSRYMLPAIEMSKRLAKKQGT